jgi:hypothetical protein
MRSRGEREQGRMTADKTCHLLPATCHLLLFRPGAYALNLTNVLRLRAIFPRWRILQSARKRDAVHT